MLAKAKSPVTLLLLLVLLVGAAVVGWRLATKPVPSLTATDAGCDTLSLQPGDSLRTSQVTVNVYNAGNVAGRADSMLADLVARGLLPGVTGNAPEDVDGKGTLVLDPDPDSAAVALVVQQLKQPVSVQRIDEDLTEGVDVVVGDKPQGILQSAPVRIKITEPTSVCVPRATAE